MQIRAVLTGALTLTDGSVLNTGTELNSFVYNTIASWCGPLQRTLQVHVVHVGVGVGVDHRFPVTVYFKSAGKLSLASKHDTWVPTSDKACCG